MQQSTAEFEEVTKDVYKKEVAEQIEREKAQERNKTDRRNRPIEESNAWEYSPYRIRVWVAYDVLPQYSDTLHARMSEEVEKLATVADSSGWKLTIEHAPAAFRYAIVHDLASFDFRGGEPELPEIADGDKLMFVGIARSENGLHVTAREYDCSSRRFSSVVHQDVATLDSLSLNVYRSIRQAFVPLARILEVDDKTVTALLRAGGLLMTGNGNEGEVVVNTGSPAWISANEICAPFQRRRVRQDKKNVMMVEPIEWTYTVVDDINVEKEPVLRCTWYSAMRAPLGSSRGTRSERILRVCKANYDSTKLFLTDRQKPPEPVAGYRIYRVLPGKEDLPSELIGRSDWRGTIEIDKDEHPLILLYILSGTRKLARLPVVPGLENELTAAMYNDSVRIRAEGLVRGMQGNLLVLITQRQSLAVQIRDALDRGELQQAEAYMNVFRTLETGKTFGSRIEQQARTLQTSDQKEEKKIAAMFNELRKLVSKHLTSDLNVTLTSEIKFVRDGGKYSELKPEELDNLKRLEEGE